MRTSWFLALLLVLAACSSDDTGAGDIGATPTAVSNCEPELARAFDAWGEAGFTGSVAIRESGELTCSAAYGFADVATDRPNTTDTFFSIGSITKTLTAAAVLQLVDEGELTLDTEAGAVVTELEGAAAELTIGDLLVHTSGLRGRHGADHEPLTREQAIANLSELDQACEPGTDFLYSNAGYSLLALVVDEITGSYRDTIVTDVAPGAGFWDGQPAPDGPRALGRFSDGGTGQDGSFGGPHWALDGNGGVAMTTEGLAQWFEGLAAGEILSDAGRDLMTTVAWDNGDGSGETPGFVAFDEAGLGEAGFGTAGGGGDIGHDMIAVWLPGSERIVVVASNTDDVRAEDLLRTIIPSYIDGEPLPLPSSTEDFTGELPGPTAASYTLGADRVAVEESADSLRVIAEGATAIAALHPPIESVGASAYVEHQAAVEAFANGETDAGREERALLEGDNGSIESVSIEGTIFEAGELRTYVTFVVSGQSLTAWIALDGNGELAAAEVGTTYPALELVPTERGWVPRESGGPVPPVVVQFDGEAMIIEGPNESEIAEAG